MVTPLKDRTPDEPGPSVARRYSTAWDTADGVSIAEARAAVRTLLSEAGHGPRDRSSQDAQLVVSELVTNAVRHAPGPGALLLEVTADGALLRVGVRDTSRHLPLLREHDPRRVGGHGLHLVGRLCDEVRAVPLDTGKQIVASLSLRGRGG
ncbi:ATP-binding protein [Streptomyces sp. NPDC006975]|uniref:ATP-binding protein n=1 Tax=Streptomyces sp. NPDC006975 TaxID=3154310 RepID=UPI00345723F0